MKSCNLTVLIALSSPLALAGQSTLPEHHAPSVSPDGKLLAYTESQGNTTTVWVANSDGSNARQLASAGAGRPRWVTNDQLQVNGLDADSGRVFLIGIDGIGRRAAAEVIGRAPLLSPRGNLVAYMSGPWTSTALMIAKPDGSAAHKIAGGNATAWNHAWRPDGKLIAYTYGEATKDPSSRVPLQVHVVAPDGTGDRAVTQVTADEGSAQTPAWSPDGKQLAIQVSARGRPAHVWIVDLTDGQVRKLNAHTEPYLDEAPAWFPDGKQLAYQSNRSGRMEVWVMNVDGTNAHHITGR